MLFAAILKKNYFPNYRAKPDDSDDDDKNRSLSSLSSSALRLNLRVTLKCRPQ